MCREVTTKQRQNKKQILSRLYWHSLLVEKQKMVLFIHVLSSCATKYTMECDIKSKFKILFGKILQPIHSMRVNIAKGLPRIYIK
jgi:hypothetical protein